MFHLPRYFVRHYGRLCIRNIQQSQYRNESLDFDYSRDFHSYFDSFVIWYEHLGAGTVKSLGILGSARFVGAYLACRCALSKEKEIVVIAISNLQCYSRILAMKTVYRCTPFYKTPPTAEIRKVYAFCLLSGLRTKTYRKTDWRRGIYSLLRGLQKTSFRYVFFVRNSIGDK